MYGTEVFKIISQPLRPFFSKKLNLFFNYDPIILKNTKNKLFCCFVMNLPIGCVFFCYKMFYKRLARSAYLEKRLQVYLVKFGLLRHHLSQNGC